MDRAPRAMLGPAEKAAFEEFCEKNEVKVWRKSLRRSFGDHHLAEVVWHEVFVATAENWELFAAMKPIRQQQWLFKTLENIAKSEHRKQTKQSPVGDALDVELLGGRNPIGGDPRPIHNEDPNRVAFEQVLAMAHRSRLSEKPSERLTERELRVFAMRHIDGYKLVEIAKMLELPQGTVRSDLNRGTAKLEALPGLRRLIEEDLA